MDPISLGFAIGVPIVATIAASITAVCYYRRHTAVEERYEEQRGEVELRIENFTSIDHSRENSPNINTNLPDAIHSTSLESAQQDNQSPLSIERQNNIVTHTTSKTYKFHNTRSFEEFKAHKTEQRSSEDVAASLVGLASKTADKIPFTDSGSDTTSAILEGAKKALSGLRSKDSDAQKSNIRPNHHLAVDNKSKDCDEKSKLDQISDDLDESASKGGDSTLSVSQISNAAASPLALPPVLMIQISPGFESRKLQNSPDKVSVGRPHRDSKISMLSGSSNSTTSSVNSHVNELKTALKVVTLQTQIEEAAAKRAEAEAKRAEAEAKRNELLERLQPNDNAKIKDASSNGSAYSYLTSSSYELSKSEAQARASNRPLKILSIKEENEDNIPLPKLSPLTLHSSGSDELPPPYSPSLMSKPVGFKDESSVGLEEPPPYTPSVRARAESVTSSFSTLDIGKNAYDTVSNYNSKHNQKMLYENSPKGPEKISAKSILVEAVHQADIMGKVFNKDSPFKNNDHAASGVAPGHERCGSVSSFKSNISTNTSDSRTSLESLGAHCNAKSYNHGILGTFVDTVPEKPEASPQNPSPKSHELFAQLRAQVLTSQKGFGVFSGARSPSPVCHNEAEEVEITHNNTSSTLSGASGITEQGE